MLCLWPLPLLQVLLLSWCFAQKDLQARRQNWLRVTFCGKLAANQPRADPSLCYCWSKAVLCYVFPSLLPMSFVQRGTRNQITVSAGGLSWSRIARNNSVSAEIHQQSDYCVSSQQSFVLLIWNVVQVKFTVFILCSVCLFPCRVVLRVAHQPKSSSLLWEWNGFLRTFYISDITNSH